MAIQRIVHIPELIFEIVENIESSNWRRDALSFGLTCKPVWRVAMRRLWRYIHTAQQLHRLLPDSHFQVDPRDYDVEHDLDLSTRTLQDSVWALFILYLPHIQIMNFDMSVFRRPCTRVIYALGRYHGAPLFARLTRLTFILESIAKLETEVVYFLSIAMTPALEELEIDFGLDFLETNRTNEPHIAVWRNVVVSLQSRKSLTGIRVYFLRNGANRELENEWRDALQDETVNLLHQLPRLRRYAVTVFREEEFLARAPLSSLAAVELDLRFSVSQADCKIPEFGPCMRQLSLVGRPKSNYVGLLRSLLSDALESLQCLFEDIGLDNSYTLDPGSHTDLRNSFFIIVDRWTTTFRSLTLEIYVVPGQEVFTLHFLLQPLLACKQLEDIEVTTYWYDHWHPFQDEDMDHWSTSWPNLSSLVIRDDFTWVFDRHTMETRRPPTATRRSLNYLAERCPQLTNLYLSIDFDDEDDELEPDSALAPPVQKGHAPFVRSFHGGYSRASDLDLAVDFIWDIFPNLESLEFSLYDLDDDQF